MWRSICIGLLSIFGVGEIATETLERSAAQSTAPLISAFPEQAWVDDDRPWTFYWKSAVSPSEAERAQIGDQEQRGPLLCCQGMDHLSLRLGEPGPGAKAVNVALIHRPLLNHNAHRALRLMTFGDSLAEISLPTALRQRLQALGFQPEMLGTTLSGQWRGQQDRTEARGGKRITDLLYLRPLSAADDNTVEPLPLGAEARYLALPATGMHMLSRKHYNPFLRRATGANLDGSAIDHNLIVKSLNTGFVGLSQTVTLGGTEARIVGFVSGAYGGVGVYRLDRSVSAYSGNIISTECARCVANGEVFDVRFYLQRFGLSDPDWIIISAGTNDFLNLMHGANGLADLAQVVRFGVDRLHGAFRLALPEAHIVFFNAALGSNPQFRSFEPNHRLLMRVTRDAVKQSADPLSHWINAAIWQSESSDWSIHPAGQDLEAEANTIADLIATVQAEWPSSIGQSRGISTSRKMPSSK